MWWPGAFSFYNNSRTLQIYVGDGQKHEAQTYYPIETPKMMVDKTEKQCCDEPNPTEAWLAKKQAAEDKANNVQVAQDDEWS